jgi:hypothetical protein
LLIYFFFTRFRPRAMLACVTCNHVFNRIYIIICRCYSNPETWMLAPWDFSFAFEL